MGLTFLKRERSRDILALVGVLDRLPDRSRNGRTERRIDYLDIERACTIRPGGTVKNCRKGHPFPLSALGSSILDGHGDIEYDFRGLHIYAVYTIP